MPNWVKNKVSLEGEGDLNLLSDFNKLKKCPKELEEVNANGTKRPEMIKKYGASDWYEWRCQNWGCKWTCSEFRIEGDACTFDTPWSTPEQAMRLFSARFPETIVTVEYADEDIGYNCGTYKLKGGEVISSALPESPQEFAEKIWGWA